MSKEEISAGENKRDYGPNLLLLNIFACIALTALAAYNPSAHANLRGLLGYPEWAAPLVFMVISLIFVGSTFRTPKHTAVNLGLMTLAGFLLLVPLPAETAEIVKWWYPLSVALIINFLINLD
jgi:phosphatidylserine synthase